MGIIKIRHWGAGKSNHKQRSSCNFTHDELAQEERLLPGKDPGDDLDDSELGEVGCEYAMIGDQMCNVPYGLYDLPDLKGILSLESWNSCLTEEERFSLAVYLPDMDQEMFGLTMKELLSGNNVYFGSPLEKLFHRLKGGFYSLQVTHFREGLQSLHKRGYCHSLRSYHEHMAQKFEDMKSAWINCLPSTSVEERVQIWNKRKDHKPVLLVDLNAFPADEEILSKGGKKVPTGPSLKKQKYINEALHTHETNIDLNHVGVKTKMKAKGVLKIKPVEVNVNSMQNLIVHPLPSDSRQPCRRQPKGVLKIKPRSDPLSQQERSIPIPFRPDQTSGGLLGFHTSRFCPPQFVSKWNDENVGQKLPFFQQTGGQLELVNQQREELFNMNVRPFNNSQSSLRKRKMVKGIRLQNAAEIQEEIFPMENSQKPRIYSDETGGIGECRNGENLWQSSGQQSRVNCAISPDSYPFAPENHQRQMTPVSEAISKISNIGTARPRTFQKYSDHSKHRHRNHGDAGLNTPSVQFQGVESGLMFPITYKRKKPYRKLNAVDSLKQPSMLVNLESIGPKIQKAKTVKIKFKGLNEYNA